MCYYHTVQISTLDLPQVSSILVSWFIPFIHVLDTHFVYIIYCCSSVDYFIHLIDTPFFCFYYEGLVRTMKTRHLLTVLFHKKRQMLRSMQNSTFRMLRLMKQMMTDPTPKVLKPPHSFYFVRYNFLFSTMYDNSLFVINHIWFCYKLLHVVVE